MRSSTSPGPGTGTATRRGSNQTIKVKQTEEVQYKLGGLVLLIEGTGRNPDTGDVMYNALATIAYDETTKVYHFFRRCASSPMSRFPPTYTSASGDEELERLKELIAEAEELCIEFQVEMYCEAQRSQGKIELLTRELEEMKERRAERSNFNGASGEAASNRARASGGCLRTEHPSGPRSRCL